MRIAEVEALGVSVPLREAVAVAGQVITARDYAIVRVHTDDGCEGLGFTYARGGDVAGAVRRQLLPLLLGEDPRETEQLWRRMYVATRYAGRHGLLMRALSAVDIALWDIKARAVGEPLWRLLGGSRRKLPVMVATGYPYPDDDDHRALAEECRRWSAAGYSAIKLMVGGGSPAEDARKVETVRAAVSAAVDLAVDANGLWKDALDAGRRIQILGEAGLRFVEEPLPPMDRDGYARLGSRVHVPLAAGEELCGRWAFRDLTDLAAVEIWRPDATYVGGISEWLKVAALAGAFGRALIPHDFPEVHLQLAAACDQVQAVEFVTRERDLGNFHRLFRNAPEPVPDGWMPPEQPGLGLQLDEYLLRTYSVPPEGA